MPAAFNPGALLGSSFALGDGLRVRLRLARSSDSGLIRALLARGGTSRQELEPGSLVHFDPRHRCVICATALVDSTETIVGVGAISRDGDSPELLIVDGERAEELREVLTAALLARTSATRRARAA